MKLGNYKGLRVRLPDLTVREEEIDKVLKRVQRRNAVIVHIDEGPDIRKETELQPIDDDFARDFSEYDTLAQWREDIREQLEEQHQISAEEKTCRKLLSLIIADSDISVNRKVVDDVTDVLYEEFLDSLEEHGISLANYIKRTGMTEEKIRKSRQKEAVFAVQSETVLRAIAKREHLEVVPEELAGELTLLAEEEEEDPAVFAAGIDDEDLAALSDQLLMDKAMDYVYDHAVFYEGEE